MRRRRRARCRPASSPPAAASAARACRTPAGPCASPGPGRAEENEDGLRRRPRPYSARPDARADPECGRGDSNPHARRHQNLNLTRLPVTPLPLEAKPTSWPIRPCGRRPRRTSSCRGYASGGQFFCTRPCVMHRRCRRGTATRRSPIRPPRPRPPSRRRAATAGPAGSPPRSAATSRARRGQPPVTDVSAEMVTAVLPLYLVLGLGLTPLPFGVLDGLYTGATALLRLAGGYVADRWRRRKLVAGRVRPVRGGQARPARGRLGRRDRPRGRRRPDRQGAAHRAAGRADRRPPPAALLGRAFGVHRAMDAAGAFLGPLAALAVAARGWPAAARTTRCSSPASAWPCSASWCSSCSSATAASRRPTARRRGRRLDARGRVRAAAPAPVRRVVAAACVLGLVTVGDGFVYLLLQRREELSLLWFPLLAARHQPRLPGAGRAAGPARRPGRPAAGAARRVRRAGGGLPAAARPVRRLAAARARPRCCTALFYAATDGVLMARRPAGPAGAAAGHRDRAGADRAGARVPALVRPVRSGVAVAGADRGAGRGRGGRGRGPPWRPRCCWPDARPAGWPRERRPDAPGHPVSGRRGRRAPRGRGDRGRYIVARRPDVRAARAPRPARRRGGRRGRGESAAPKLDAAAVLKSAPAGPPPTRHLRQSRWSGRRPGRPADGLRRGVRPRVRGRRHRRVPARRPRRGPYQGRLLDRSLRPVRSTPVPACPAGPGSPPAAGSWRGPRSSAATPTTAAGSPPAPGSSTPRPARWWRRWRTFAVVPRRAPVPGGRRERLGRHLRLTTAASTRRWPPAGPPPGPGRPGRAHPA